MLNKLMNLRKKKGFTLIELIVVLVIMAILAAAAIPTVMGYIENSRKAAYLANVRAVYQAGQSAIAEAMAAGTAITISDNDFTITGSTKFSTRVGALTDFAAANIKVYAAASGFPSDAKKDTYHIAVDATTGKITEIRGFYQDKKYVEFEPGADSNVMDTATAPTPTPTTQP